MKKPFLSYTTRHHLQRRVHGTDWLFIAAALALVIGVAVVIWRA